MLPHRFEFEPAITAFVAFTPAQAAAAAHAARVIREVRYRTVELSADDVLAMRELTAVADDLDAVGTGDASDFMRASVARLGALRSALGEFVTAAHTERDGDAEHLPLAYSLVDAIADVHDEALDAAVHGASAHAGC